MAAERRRANYRDVGPVNRARALDCVRALGEAAADPDRVDLAAAALHALAPDMPDLRFTFGGDVLDLAQAEARMRAKPDADLAGAAAKAVRRVLDHLPANLPAPAVLGTVEQLREALRGRSNDTQVDVLVDGVRRRVRMVEGWGKGTPFSGVTLACGGRED